MAQIKLRLTFFNSHNTSDNKSAEIEIPLDGLTCRELLMLGNKSLDLESGKEIYLECGKKLTDPSCLRDGDKLFIHDNVYPHGQINQPISIAICGPGAVGKSAITQRIIDNTFEPDYDPTIEDLFEKSMNVDGYNIVLNILDTAGQEDFKGLREGQMRDKNGYILVYSVISRDTFDDLETFYETLCDVLDSEQEVWKPLILCGNKVDLPPTQHVINDNERNERKRQWMASNIYNTSALNGHNIKNMIGWLVREIINDLYPTHNHILPDEDDNVCSVSNCFSHCVFL
eukprot:168228_1